MTAPLCRARPADWWTPDDDGARLALAICHRCPDRDGCAAGDPQPHGVIRAGQAWSDAGAQLPVCGCGYPVDDYRGGTVTPCRRCRTPDTPIPDPGEVRRRTVRLLVRAGHDDHALAAALGVQAGTAKLLRQKAGILHRPGTRRKAVAA